MRFLAAVVSLLLVTLFAQAVVWAQAPQKPVERDRTGEKYHRETGRYLSKSKIPLELKEAAARLRSM